MIGKMLKNIIGAAILSSNCFVFAADVQDHILSTENLEQRQLFIEFTTNKGIKFALVRANKEDLDGFIAKDKSKSPEEREKFNNQFNIETSKRILEVYQNAQKWSVQAFTTYQFGLFSIYKLEETAGIFCGELYLDDQSLSQSGFVEISIDIAPASRRQGIGKAAKKATLEQLVAPNLKKTLAYINYSGTTNSKLFSQKGFFQSKKPLMGLKSKVEFSNFPSHAINKGLGLVPENFAIDYSVVYVYPKLPSSITPEALVLVKALTDPNEEKRQEAIQILRYSIDQMK